MAPTILLEDRKSDEKKMTYRSLKAIALLAAASSAGGTAPATRRRLPPLSELESVAATAHRTLWYEGLAAAANLTTSSTTLPEEGPRHWRRRAEAACEPSVSSKWIQSKLEEIDSGTRSYLFGMSLGGEQLPVTISDLPWISAYYGDGKESDHYFGKDGAHTVELLEAHDSNEDFWEEDDGSEPILLLGFHGSDLGDETKMRSILQLLFPGSSSFEISNLVSEFQSKIRSNVSGGFDNPVFSFNAFAVSGESDPSTGIFEPDAILIGDGVLESLSIAGLGSEGPEAVHAHEYAHHVQFEAIHTQVADADTSSESRRLELMADGFGSYFLAHDLGGDMEPGQIADVNDVAYSVGDCNPSSANHHGTPTQRHCASVWGASLAATESDDDKGLRAKELVERFDEALPGILANSSNTCSLILEGASNDSSDGPESSAILIGIIVGAIVASMVVILAIRRIRRRRRVVDDSVELQEPEPTGGAWVDLPTSSQNAVTYTETVTEGGTRIVKKVTCRADGSESIEATFYGVDDDANPAQTSDLYPAAEVPVQGAIANTPSTSPSTQLPRDANGHEEVVERLMAMGFPREASVQALAVTNWNEEMAANALLDAV